MSETTAFTVRPADTMPPALIGVSPPDGAIDVALDTTVSFTFSEAMGNDHAIHWEGSDVTITYSGWSADQRTFTLRFGAPLNSHTTLRWAINPPGADPGFQDLAGNPVPTGLYSGQFTTKSLVVVPLRLAIEWVEGKPLIKVEGELGQTCVLEQTDSLSQDRDWEALTTFTLLTNPHAYIDDGATDSRHRYYRARIGQ